MRGFLFISYSGAIGGAERLLLDFAEGLDGELSLACPEGPLAEAARAAGLRVFSLSRRSLRWRGGLGRRGGAAVALLGHALETRALIRALDPDLVLAWGMRSAVAILLFGRPDVPVVFQHNDLLPEGTWLRRLVRAAAARADLVVALSDAIATDLGGAVRVVHPGIDVDAFPRADGSANPREVLVLGALVGWKRPDLALEAVARARRSVPDARLRLVGAALPDDDEAFVAQLRERAGREDLSGAVEFVGAVADPRPELARASCLLHCAEREPFGMAVLEGLAAGLPVVVPAAAGPVEIADASCGVLYPPGAAGAAGDAVARVLEDPLRAAGLGAAGRERARARFGHQGALARYREAVTPVARGRSVAAPPSPVALVTVTHNSARELGGLLASVERHLPQASVVVVDCASADESVAVAEAWTGHRSILPIDNVGFGRACNLGLAEVTAPVTVLVNPDVELLDDSLLSAVATALTHDRLLAPLVLTPAGRREDSVHPVPASLPDLLGTLLPHRMAPAQLVPWRSDHPRPVGWAVGCALIARTDTLRRLGPFDEHIFLYGEDLDLSLRAAEAGVETWFWPAARVLHHRSHATLQAFGGEPFERLARARHEVVLRRLGPRRARLDDAAQALLFTSRLVGKRLLRRPAERERHLLQALRHGRAPATRP